jgi:uncharacterized cupin superfamily protein
MVPEAPMQDGPGGKKPAGEGWYVMNAREAEWIHNEKFGAGVTFEGEPGFPHYGINIQVMWPGQPNCYYHAEEGQEDFLVLSGECILLVEGQERPLKAWDFVHCPPWTEHVFVGAGDGTCVILMVGARPDPEALLYPVSEVAQRHNASAEKETPSAEEAYTPYSRATEGPYPEGTLPG